MTNFEKVTFFFANERNYLRKYEARKNSKKATGSSVHDSVAISDQI